MKTQSHERQPITQCTETVNGRACGTIFRPPEPGETKCRACRAASGARAKRIPKSYDNESVLRRMDGGKTPFGTGRDKGPKFLFGRLKETK